MTESEAIKGLRNIIENWTYKPHEVEVAETAIKALEKQIPKKITHEATLHKCCTCPNCKNVIDEFEQFGENKVRVKYNYCHFCGQKLDWD